MLTRARLWRCPPDIASPALHGEGADTPLVSFEDAGISVSERRVLFTNHQGTGFSSVPMDEEHLHHAFRYITLNPIRARLVDRVQDWRWSSTTAHLAEADDHVVKVPPALERVGDFAAVLGEPFDEAMRYAALREPEATGRLIVSNARLAAMEARTGLSLVPQKRGPKSRANDKERRCGRGQSAAQRALINPRPGLTAAGYSCGCPCARSGRTAPRSCRHALPRS